MRVSNSLDPDQDQLLFGPVQGPNCLQRLSADNIFSHLRMVSFNIALFCMHYPDYRTT